VKQLALGTALHLNAKGHYPSGGWGYFWVGDADRGSGAAQPGGWVYNILPYIEQQNLHDLPMDGDPNTITQKQKDGARTMVTRPIEIVNCPTRREPTNYPKPGNGTFIAYNSSDNPPGDNIAGKLDYGINAGDTWPYVGGFAGPTTMPAAGQLPPMQDMTGFTGVSFAFSQVPAAAVRDGTSRTYLVGEKYLMPDKYVTGNAGEDNETWCSGFNNDNFRSGAFGPMRDKPGFDASTDARYGSRHAKGFTVAMCDGSVRTMDFGIDLTVHGRLANRQDGQAADYFSASAANSAKNLVVFANAFHF
jgi:prepilin-type processing-associated H-X9-DG protein